MEIMKHWRGGTLFPHFFGMGGWEELTFWGTETWYTSFPIKPETILLL